MKHLLQAIRMSMRYKYSLITSIACSAMVAIFWGANITAVYPFVEIVFQGKTLHDWVDHQLVEVDQDLAHVAEPAARNPVVPTPEQVAANRAQLVQKQARLEKAKVWISRFAPRDPFQTLIAIVVFLLVGTLLKSVFRIVSLVTVTCVA